jgi:hypothetical protein
MHSVGVWVYHKSVTVQEGIPMASTCFRQSKDGSIQCVQSQVCMLISSKPKARIYIYTREERAIE